MDADTESAEELKQMLLVEKVASIKEKVQLLYLLKTGWEIEIIVDVQYQ
ncbi:hypothetical protein [Nostoc sp. T09]|nr:hypothetical protein [Nostoc sp. T09]